MQKSYGTSIAAVLFSICCVQIGASVAKSMFPIAGAMGTSALRLGFAALILLLVWRPWRKPVPKRAIKYIVAYGAVLGMTNLLFYLALERIPLGLVVALEFTGPLGVALLASRKPIDFLWALMAVLGILFILPVSPWSGSAIDLVGVLIALAAGVFWGGYIILSERVGRHIETGRATALGMVVAALVVIPASASQVTVALWSMEIIPLGIAVAVMSSAIPYSLEMWALKSIPTQTFGIMMSLEPAVGALAGLFVLGEHLTTGQWVALTLVMLASLGSTLTARPKKVPESVLEKMPEKMIIT